jgi:hypothetical protein
MMTTNVELYEALKPTVGTEAARMIAEVVPPTRELATKADVAETNTRIDALRGEMREGFAQIRVEIHESQNSTLKWFLGFSVPLWLGTWGTMAAVLLKG